MSFRTGNIIRFSGSAYFSAETSGHAFVVTIRARGQIPPLRLIGLSAEAFFGAF